MPVLDTEVRQNFSYQSYWPLAQTCQEQPKPTEGSQRDGRPSWAPGADPRPQQLALPAATLSRKDKDGGKWPRSLISCILLLILLLEGGQAGCLLCPAGESFLYSSSFHCGTRIASGHRAASLPQLSVFRAVCARETGFSRMEGDVPSQVSLNEFPSNGRKP